jgi:hypothetical protein
VWRVCSSVRVAQVDLSRGTRFSDFNCSMAHIWEAVRPGVPPDAPTEIGAAGYRVRDSVMEAFTQHNPRACLTHDDVEALSVLYPDCSPVTLSTNTCYKVESNIGFVRVMMCDH